MSRWRFAWAWFVAATLSAPLAAQWAPATAGWQVAGVVSPATGTVTTTGTVLVEPVISSVVHVGVAGGLSYTYAVVAVGADGTHTAASASASVLTSTVLPLAGHLNRITWGAVTGAVSYDVYLVTADTEVQYGKLGNTTALTWDDAAGTGDGSTAPTTNTTHALAAGQVALGSGATSITGDSGCTWTGTGTSFALTIGGDTTLSRYAANTFRMSGALTAASSLTAEANIWAMGKAIIGPGADTYLSRASAGTLLVEDGSGNARDVQARAVIVSTSGIQNTQFGGYVRLVDYQDGSAHSAALGLGHFYPLADNTQDLGVVGGLWRTGRFGTSVVTPRVDTASGNLTLGNTGTPWFTINGAGEMDSTYAKAFTFAGITGLRYAGSGSDAVMQLGMANSATPLSQTLQAQGSRAGTDTNVAGGNLTIRPGAGTGSATGSSIVFQTPNAIASGSGAQGVSTRLTINEIASTFTKNGASSVQVESSSASSFATLGVSNDLTHSLNLVARGSTASGTFLGVANADSTQFYSYNAPALFGTLSAHDFVIGTNDAEQLRFVSGGAIKASVPVRLQGYTVATLPSGTVGDTAYVTDATAPTYLGALTGGGAVVVPVFFDGTSWKSH